MSKDKDVAWWALPARHYLASAATGSGLRRRLAITAGRMRDPTREVRARSEGGRRGTTGTSGRDVDCRRGTRPRMAD